MIFQINEDHCDYCKQVVSLLKKNKKKIYSVRLTPDYRPGTNDIENWHLDNIDIGKE
uniref:Uncharacterized protein n=1 Tax=viral metagenome TaxID=1070528 RepID=A0A6M3L9F3_9ZZZZ